MATYLRNESNLAEMSDQQLLDDFVQSRSPESFRLIVDRYSALVLGICRKVIGDPVCAEDAFQETFIELINRAHKIDQPQHLSSWLFVVAKRTALRVAKGNQTREVPNQELVATTLDQSSIEATPLDSIRTELFAAIEELEPEDQTALVVCFLNEQSHAAASKVLGIPRGSISYRLGQSLAKLKARLRRRGVIAGTALLFAVMQSTRTTAQVGSKTMKQVLTLPSERTVGALQIRSYAAGTLWSIGIAASLFLLIIGITSYTLLANDNSVETDRKISDPSEIIMDNCLIEPESQ